MCVLLRGKTKSNDREASVFCEWRSLWLVYDVYHAWLVSFYVLRSIHIDFVVFGRIVLDFQITFIQWNIQIFKYSL